MARKAKPVKRGRRKRGTGTVSLRKDGRWQWSHVHNGKRYTGYAATYEEADRLVLEAIAKADKQGFVSERITIGEWLQEWITGKELDSKANSLDIWGRAVHDRLIPALGSMALADLRRRDAQALVNAWTSEGLSPNTIRTYFAPLHNAIVDAIQSDIISDNPCRYIKFPKEDHDEEEEQQALDIEQAKLLLQQLEGQWIRPLILLALAIGLRRGELVGLKWKDIDFKTGKLQVRRNVAQIPGKGYIEDSPKSKSSKRTISLPDFALSMLKDLRIEQGQRRWQVGSDWQDLDLVFCREDGGYINKDTPGYFLDKALRAAGLPDITFHKLRHSAGSILLALGIEVTVVSKILGHSNPGVTMRVYAHMLPGKDEDAMIRYNDAYWASESQKRAN